MATEVSTVISDLAPEGSWVGSVKTSTLQRVMKENPVGVITIADADSPYTVGTGVGLLLVANTSALTVNLPAAADSAGRVLTVKKTTADAEIVTLDGNASETINGATTNTSIDANHDTLTLACDGTGWHIVASIIA